MKALFDTSVLVAALVRSHPHHGACAAWLAAAKAGLVELVVSGHTLAELYSTLTRSSLVPQLSPSQVAQLIRNDVLAFGTVAALTGGEYGALVDRLALAGIAGGAVYDGVHAEVARSQNVDAIVTVNVPHFARVYSGTILSPLTDAPPTP